MKKETRLRFNQLCDGLAQSYGVTDVRQSFSIEPSIAQSLSDKIVEQSTFLPSVNIVPVDELEGESIFGFITSPVSGRTDTMQDGKERQPKHLLGMEARRYRLFQTNSDVALRYNIMDTWAKFPDLNERYTRYVQERIANDREIIGWHGKSAAKDTDLVANPLLEDVNKGWMQYMREWLPANILPEGVEDSGVIRIGAGGDYECLDEAVFDMLQGIPVWLRKDLIVYVGNDLIAREKSELFKAVRGKPTEKTLMDAAMGTLGGLPYETPSNFPARGLVITRRGNLSIYHQTQSWRRKIEDNPKKDQVEDYISRNEGYVVETPECFVALEFANVKVADGKGGWE